MVFVFHRKENIVGKGENADYHQHFLLCPQCFQKAVSSGSLKVGCVVKCLRPPSANTDLTHYSSHYTLFRKQCKYNKTANCHTEIQASTS